MIMRNASAIATLMVFVQFLCATVGQAQIFVVSNPGQNVSAYDLNSGATLSVPLIGTGLSSPNQIAMDGNGFLYVAKYANGTIGKYTTSGITVNASLLSGLAGPVGVAADGGGNLFVADYNNGT